MGFYPEQPAEPKWVEYRDFDPDKQRSCAGMWVEPDDKGNYRYVLQVKRLGFIVMRATSIPDDPRGRLQFEGVSILSDQEVGHRR